MSCKCFRIYWILVCIYQICTLCMEGKLISCARNLCIPPPTCSEGSREWSRQSADGACSADNACSADGTRGVG